MAMSMLSDNFRLDGRFVVGIDINSKNWLYDVHIYDLNYDQDNYVAMVSFPNDIYWPQKKFNRDYNFDGKESLFVNLARNYALSNGLPYDYKKYRFSNNDKTDYVQYTISSLIYFPSNISSMRCLVLIYILI